MAYTDETRMTVSEALPDMLDAEAFSRRLEMAVKMAGRQKQEVALLLLALPVSSADAPATWRECARNIRASVRITDCLARLDERRFGILLAVEDQHGACAASRKIHATVSKGLPESMPLASGLAIFPHHACDAGQLYMLAEEALDHSTQQDGALTLAEATPRSASELRHRLRQRLGEALRLEEIVLGFQPVVSLHSGLPVAAEALARWEHPGLGRLDPGEFVSHAEQAEYAEPFNLHILDRAIWQLARWQEQGIRMRISLNLSAMMLDVPEFDHLVAARLASNGVRAASLCLEIRDAALSRLSPLARRSLFSLAAQGVGLCIDDFGRGEGSVFALRDLPVDTLKLDVALCAGACRNDDDARIFETLLELGHKCGKQVIAKGVESEAMRDRLSCLGCEFAQGYYYTGALTGTAFEHWRAERLAHG